MAQYQRGGRGNYQPPAPKPYGLVPLPKRTNRAKPVGHDRYQADCCTGHITGTIEALSPIHIGSGIVDLGTDVPLIKTAVRTRDQIVIPGSSLKGATRSVVEAISESCICKSRIRFDQMPKGFGECRRKESLCVACRMFGAMGFQGSISIHDAPLVQGNIETRRIPELYAPSSRRQRYFDHSRQVAGRKFYMHGQLASGNTPVEACAIGSKFRFSVQMDNLDSAQWGLFLVALGLHPDYPFKLKIGGAKPVCFGSVDIRVERVVRNASAKERYLDWESHTDSILVNDQLNQWMGDCMDASLNSVVVRDQLEELSEILCYPNQRSCPSGMY